MTKRDGREPHTRSTVSNQAEWKGNEAFGWLMTNLAHAQSRVTKETNTDDHETENPQSTGGERRTEGRA